MHLSSLSTNCLFHRLAYGATSDYTFHVTVCVMTLSHYFSSVVMFVFVPNRHLFFSPSCHHTPCGSLNNVQEKRRKCPHTTKVPLSWIKWNTGTFRPVRIFLFSYALFYIMHPQQLLFWFFSLLFTFLLLLVGIMSPSGASGVALQLFSRNGLS